MGKLKLVAVLLAGSLLAATESSAQTPPPPVLAGPGDGPVTLPGIVPEAFRVPAPPAEIGNPMIPPGCSLALCDPPPERPNAFCGEQDCGPCTRTIDFSGEYLLWWTKNGPAPPPLLTTATGDIINNQGFIGEPGTEILYGGGGDIDYGTFSGLRLRGLWSPDQCVFLEARGFWLPQRSSDFVAASDGAGNPLLARPVTATQRVAENPEVVFLVSFPNLLNGSFTVTNTSKFDGYEFNLGANWRRWENGYIDALVGFRSFTLEEGMRIVSRSLNLVDDPPLIFDNDAFRDGSEATVTEVFNTLNRFHGAQVGLRAGQYWGPFSIMGDVRLAVGRTAYTSFVNGTSQLTTRNNFGTDLLTVPYGVLAVRSNSGAHTERRGTFIPDLGATFGYQLASNLQVTAGFNFIYWGNVARPGLQVDRRVETRQVPTDFTFDRNLRAYAPPPVIVRSEFWATGLTFGFRFTF